MTLTYRALEHDLRRRVDGEIRFDAGSRGTYSTDASNYRQVPVGVVVPRTVEAGAETVAVCAGHGVPVVSRGGGTSLAGQSCNAAVVIDWSKSTCAWPARAARRTAHLTPGIGQAAVEVLEAAGWRVIVPEQPRTGTGRTPVHLAELLTRRLTAKRRRR